MYHDNSWSNRVWLLEVRNTNGISGLDNICRRAQCKTKCILKKYTFASDVNYNFSAGTQRRTGLAISGRYIACLTLLGEERSQCRQGTFTIEHNDTSLLLNYTSAILTNMSNVSCEFSFLTCLISVPITPAVTKKQYKKCCCITKSNCCKRVWRASWSLFNIKYLFIYVCNYILVIVGSWYYHTFAIHVNWTFLIEY